MPGLVVDTTLFFDLETQISTFWLINDTFTPSIFVRTYQSLVVVLFDYVIHHLPRHCRSINQSGPTTPRKRRDKDFLSEYKHPKYPQVACTAILFADLQQLCNEIR
jgi:hypothetical protein